MKCPRLKPSHLMLSAVLVSLATVAFAQAPAQTQSGAEKSFTLLKHWPAPGKVR